jgi:hypothetical protein
MRLPYPHRRLSITFAAAHCHYRLQIARAAQTVAKRGRLLPRSRRRGGPLGPSYGLVTRFLVASPPSGKSEKRIHGSLKGRAEPLASGWRSLVIERVIGRSDVQSPKRCSCAWGSCFAKAPAGKLPPRSSTFGPTRAAVDTPSCVDLGGNMYLFRPAHPQIEDARNPGWVRVKEIHPQLKGKHDEPHARTR